MFRFFLAMSFLLFVIRADNALAQEAAGSVDSPAVFSGRGMPYAEFDRLPASQLPVGDAMIQVAFAPGELELPQSRILGWIYTSARAVATYYGRFPVRHARVLVIPFEGRGIRRGASFGYAGAATRLSLGRSTRMTDLESDWVLVHELVHLAFPLMPNAHHWIEEGIATYVEPIARAQIGQLSVEKVWGDLIDGLPKGLPAEGDQGLDHTHTWGRTYWGGALFCLLADIEIRQRTGNRHGLQDALRAIVAAGGNIEVDWPITRAFKIGDEATGAPALSELYERMRSTPVDVDLAALWRRLGIEVRDGAVTFNDQAPLAAIRRAITADLGSAPE